MHFGKKTVLGTWFLDDCSHLSSPLVKEILKQQCEEGGERVGRSEGPAREPPLRLQQYKSGVVLHSLVWPHHHGDHLPSRF